MEKPRVYKQSSFDGDSLLAKVFCRWVFPIYKICRYKRLELEDVYKCSEEDEAKVLVEKLERNWQKELQKKRPFFFRAFLKTFISKMWYPLLAVIIEECFLKICQPILIGILVKYFSDSKSNDFLFTCVIASCFCFTLFLSSFITYSYNMFLWRNPIKMRAAWCSIIYKKCLKLDRFNLSSKTTVGRIVNLMANDSSQFEEFCLFINYLVVIPLQISIFVYVAWQILGVACLASLGGLFLFIPFFALMGRKFSSIKSQAAHLTDKRMRLVNEVIRGIRMIKLYNWEQYFVQMINHLREKEIDKMKVALFNRGITISISFMSSRMVLFLSFITYVMLGGQLTADKIFVTVAMFERIRYILTWMLSQAIARIAEMLVSCSRMQEFLLAEEVSFDKKPKINYNGLNVENLNISLKRDSSKESTFSLKNITFKARPKELVAVIGPVGSGKTSLFSAVLGELNSVTANKLEIGGRTGFVSQESWCFNGTIRQNILLGESFDLDKYNRVIKVCALEQDLIMFPDGDLTLIGDRGIVLSGGQKTRINLARAVYQDADVYFLDDPLSAVDVAVGKHIFENCILGYLQSKTVILITHQLQYLKNASKILFLNNGECKVFNGFDELVSSGTDFVSIIKDSGEVNQNLVDGTKENEQSYKSEDNNENDLYSKAEDSYESGESKFKIYWNYFTSGPSFWLLLAVLISTVLTQFLYNFTDYFLTIWAKQRITKLFDFYNVMFLYLSLGLLICAIIRSITFFTACLQASKNVHLQILNKLLRLPLATIDNNPIGHILNRFTHDMTVLDEWLPTAAFSFSLAFFQVLAIVVMVSSISPITIFFAFLFVFSLVYIRNIFKKPFKEFRRLESLTRSPIYSHVSVTLDGLTTIRAFSAQEKFLQQFYFRLNDYSATCFLRICSKINMGMILDGINIGYISSVVFILLAYSSGISEANAGMTFSYIFNMMGITQWAIKMSVDVEYLLTSVEKLVYYSKLPMESQRKTTVELKKWPQRGEIQMKNVSLSYPNNSKQVLDNLNIHINGREKVGIVGRTGAGKSSVISALFHLFESSGQIIIDGVDIKEISLHDLRENISIIPQDPVIFTGTIRKNLDPFDEHSDEELWQVLEDVQLKDTIMNISNKLNTNVMENAINFSTGQKQLICLARSILKKNQILILDEATANIDYRTDSLIQRTIKEKFTNCTVITIAHRINTVIESDRVLVLDDGKVVEFGAPHSLLEAGGCLTKLVDQTGESMAKRLKEQARQAFQKSRLADNLKQNSLLNGGQLRKRKF